MCSLAEILNVHDGLRPHGDYLSHAIVKGSLLRPLQLQGRSASSKTLYDSDADDGSTDETDAASLSRSDIGDPVWTGSVPLGSVPLGDIVCYADEAVGGFEGFEGELVLPEEAPPPTLTPPPMLTSEVLSSRLHACADVPGGSDFSLWPFEAPPSPKSPSVSCLGMWMLGSLAPVGAEPAAGVSRSSSAPAPPRAAFAPSAFPQLAHGIAMDKLTSCVIFEGRWLMSRYEGDADAVLKDVGLSWAMRKLAKSVSYGTGRFHLAIKQQGHCMSILFENGPYATTSCMLIGGGEQEIVTEDGLRVIATPWWEREVLRVEGYRCDNYQPMQSIKRYLTSDGELVAESIASTGIALKRFYTRVDVKR